MHRGEGDPLDPGCSRVHPLHQQAFGRRLERRRNIRGQLLVALAGALAALAAPAAAQPPDPAVEIHLEYYRPKFESRVRLDSVDLGAGTLIGLEDELGLDDSGDAVRGEIVFRPGERFRVALDYAAFERNGAATIERQIRYGDVLYRAGAVVGSRVESEFAALGLGFALVSNASAEAGLTLSAAWASIEASLSGRASIGPLPPVEITETARAEGAAPMLGVWASGWIVERVRLSGNVRYLRLDDFQDWSGDALDYGARVEWFVLPNVAVAVGWGGTELDAESEEASELARAEYSYRGARAGVTFAF
ncbi:MAG: hypothetical protein F9K18_11360 [Thermoanaerobaculia bacterium]|nr:MAG: hypothetical protein F9K18_11360 [Thermoanaerobaculia bacterium]